MLRAFKVKKRLYEKPRRTASLFHTLICFVLRCGTVWSWLCWGNSLIVDYQVVDSLFFLVKFCQLWKHFDCLFIVKSWFESCNSIFVGPIGFQKLLDDLFEGLVFILHLFSNFNSFFGRVILVVLHEGDIAYLTLLTWTLNVFLLSAKQVSFTKFENGHEGAKKLPKLLLIHLFEILNRESCLLCLCWTVEYFLDSVLRLCLLFFKDRYQVFQDVFGFWCALGTIDLTPPSFDLAICEWVECFDKLLYFWLCSMFFFGIS